MGTHGSGDDTIAAIERRIPIVECLVDAPKDKRTIEAAIGLSRSTVDRGIRELELLGFVEYRDGEYAPTLSGRIVAEEYRRFQACIESVRETQHLLDGLPCSLELDSRVLIGAERSTAGKPVPYRPDHDLIYLLRNADTVWGISGSVQPEYVELFCSQILKDGMYNEMVFETGVVDYLRTAYPEEFAAMLKSGNLVIYELEEDLPFSLKLIKDSTETTLAFAIYDTSSKVKAILINRSDAAIEWGCETYAKYRDLATPLQPTHNREDTETTPEVGTSE